MIPLDANVLVRFLVVDDKAQPAKAAKLVDGAVARNETLFVSDVVICETVCAALRSTPRMGFCYLGRCSRARSESTERGVIKPRRTQLAA